MADKTPILAAEHSATASSASPASPVTPSIAIPASPVTPPPPSRPRRLLVSPTIAIQASPVTPPPPSRPRRLLVSHTAFQVRVLNFDDTDWELPALPQIPAPSIYSYGSCERDTFSELCVVCLNDFTLGENVAILECKHQFHANCIHTWLLRKNVCPVCNRIAIKE